MTFLFNFYAKQRWLKRWGKMVGQAVIPGNFKRRCEEEKILYLRKFSQNIRNNNEGPQLLEDTAD